MPYPTISAGYSYYYGIKRFHFNIPYKDLQLLFIYFQSLFSNTRGAEYKSNSSSISNSESSSNAASLEMETS